MKHYIEITLIPDTKVGLFSLWSKVYPQLHLALVEIKNADSLVPVGVSFADYHADDKHSLLGSKLRIFAVNVETLEKLNLNQWFARLTDYVHISSIRAVPSDHGHVVVSRVHVPANAGSLARRYAKRHNMSLESAMEVYKNYTPKVPKHLAYIQLKSLSTTHDFTLCIMQSVCSTATSGLYSTYGLSSTTTVPHW
jgi:CRISPR-associated endonuclease Csy4